MNKLKEGDIIIIKEGHRIYADVPEHFIYANKKGSFLLSNTDITVEGDFKYFQGKYIVIKTNFEGGGTGHGANDVYPNGHRVYCVKIDSEDVKISFYQSGCFTAMIENIKPVGKAKLTWVQT